MSVDQSQLDLNTLQWVKSEIDTTLKQARQALEIHVESPADSNQLKLITNYLHQVRGTLQMVELYGAAMLAEELEYLAQDLSEQTVAGRDDIYEVMMQAMWQLPDYLERLQAGFKDIPMVLLPLLNDLRAARGQPLLTESALFTPDLDVDLPVTNAVGNESLQVLAKKLRHTYHLGLLDWFRDRDSKGGIKKLDGVIQKLRSSANDPEVNRVLWSASGVLEALAQGGIETSVAVKLLMGQVDRQIKKIIDHGESALTAEPPAELEKNLLYYVASSSSSGERVNELKEKFKLADALPNAETLEQARVDLTGPNAELMQTVSTVLLDNLLQVKDTLDLMVRTEEKGTDKLPALAGDLSQIADTLGMLGFGKQRQTIQEQATVLKTIAAGKGSLDEAVLMDIAQALLSVETMLQGNVLKSADAAGDQAGLGDATQDHLLIDSVMVEARANMAKVKDALSLYLDMPRNTNLIADVPGLLDQIRGSFDMLDMQRAAGLIAGCRDYVQTGMINARRSQDPAQMDALADAISSIEYFMDSVAGQWGNPDTILNVAAERLASIGVGVQAGVTGKAAGAEDDDIEVPAEPESILEVIPQTDDTMIDLGSPGFELGSDDSIDMMDIDLSDMSTSELSLADFEKELAKHQTENSSDDSQETGLDSSLISLEELPGELLLDESEETGNTSNDTQEIELSSAMLELDRDPFAEDEAPAEQAGNTSNDTQEIDLDSAILEIGGSLELELDEPALSGLEEIDFDSALQELDASIEAMAANPFADSGVTENSSNETQEIEFDSALLDLGDSLELEPVTDSGLADIEELMLEPLPEAAPPPAEAKPAKKLSPPVSTADIETQLFAWYDDTQNKKLMRGLQKDLKTIKQFAKDTDQDDISRIAKDMIAVVKAVQDGESELTDDIRNILQLANVTLTELFDTAAVPAAVTQEAVAESRPATVEVAHPPIAKPAGKSINLPDDIDEEIAEIFIEEAREEHANISRLLPIWSSDTSNEEPLSDLRRSFHTLKGSGRLVGASDIGEFAWAFENMLNRVIDNTVEPDPVMFDLLALANDTLPTLLEMFVAGEKPGQDIFALMEQAEALSQGKTVPSIETATPNTPHDKADEPHILDQSDDAPLAPVVDAVLLDIYRKEVESHLTALHSYIEGWRDEVDQSVNAKLLRTVHTLTGCSRTASVPTLAEVFGRAEGYLRQLAEHNTLLSEAAVRMLIGCIDFVEHTMVLLDRPGASLPDNQALLAEIQALHEEALAEAEAMPSQSNITRLQPIGRKAVESADVQPDYDEELLGIFIEEASEILEESDHSLHQWSGDRQNPELITVMQRLLHTLKGGARLAGLIEMGDLSHSLESMLEAIVDGQLEMSDEAYQILMIAQDALVNMLDQVKLKQPLSAANDIIRMVEVLLNDGDGEESVQLTELDFTAADEPDADIELMDEPVDEQPPAPVPAPVPVSDSPTPPLPNNVVPLTALTRIEQHAPVVSPEDQLPTERASARELVRVRSELLDNLVNFAGEVSIYRSRMEQQTNAFRYNLQELDDTVDRLREQLRNFEMEAEAQIQYRAEESFSQSHEDFDPLEFDRFTQMQQLSRGMMESLNDLDSLRTILAGLTRESETLLVQQSRVNTELQEGLMRTRMVPFSSQANRLRRIVRQTADELGKQAELHLHGADSEIDRTVLERMLPALEHMLRNAVAHGVESPAERAAVGKSEVGQVNLALTREGADIVLTLTDDGRGIDLSAIQQKAIEKGKLKPNSHVTREILFDLIMESGFSTADEVTQISGRGVGMDVVNNEIKQLGGLLNIETEQGSGTRFTVSLPLTLSLTRALMVQVSEDVYALPLLSVEGVERISTEQLLDLYNQDKPVYQWLGKDYPFMHLGSAMGISTPHVPQDRNRIPLLLVRSGEYCAAVQVDNLIGSREIVVKPVGPQLSTMRGIAGATIMGDGGVVLIIDLGVLVRAASIQQELLIEPIAAQIVEEPEVREPVIMVIDDSITVRKVTTRLLERNNYRAVSAKDGVDALAQLQDIHPDVMLLDVEMPRMDGFELATNVRNDERLKDIPIIMITSRTGQKHRDRADKIGVNIYMGKPFSEGELLENIQAMLEL